MGFMDKAKKMAEQAQAKLDEAQKQFNAGQQPGQQPGAAVEYDEHGRPVAQASPAAPPHGDPLAAEAAAGAAPQPTPGVPQTGQGDPVASPPGPSAQPVAQPGVPPTAAAPSARPGEAPAPQSPPAVPEPDAADADRNHPSYAPPQLSSGDPLAG
jgi:hypothetical protein